MKNYPNHCDVQSFGCFALGRLYDSNEEHAGHFVNTMKGHDVIIAAMNKFPDDTLAQRWACFALAVLCNYKQFVGFICDAGGRQAFLHAIVTHKDECKEHVKEIQAHARPALRSLLE
jgi:hypothetical protein